MKKFGLVLLLIAAMATPALAAPTTFQMGVSAAQPFGPYKSAVGGEFTLTPTSPFIPLTGYVSGVTSDLGVKGSFQTFCIEADKPIDGYPATYFGDMADTASRGTGWLYSQFAMGILADYVWAGAGRLDTAYLLQQTIWWLEGYSVVRCRSMCSRLRSWRASAPRQVPWVAAPPSSACLPSTCSIATPGCAGHARVRAGWRRDADAAGWRAHGPWRPAPEVPPVTVSQFPRKKKGRSNPALLLVRRHRESGRAGRHWPSVCSTLRASSAPSKSAFSRSASSSSRRASAFRPSCAYARPRR